MSDGFDLLLAGGGVLEAARLRDSVGGELIAEPRVVGRWTSRRGELFQGLRKER